MTRRRWTSEDQRALEMMRRLSMPLRVIGEILGRSPSTLKKYYGPVTSSVSLDCDDRDLRLIPGQIDADDLEWMRHYRNQARARQRALTEAQQALREGKSHE